MANEDPLKMRDTRFMTIVAPNIVFNSDSPDPINPEPGWFGDWNTPTRVIVRNISAGARVFLSLDLQTAKQSTSGGEGRYVLPAGQADVFVLGPRQKMYFSSNGDGCEISYAISEYVFPE